MNVLYGVQTTGNGHIVRAKSMIRELTASGHRVHALLSGGDWKEAIGLAAFQSFERKNGLTFVVENGRLRYFKTARQLNFVRFYRDISGFDVRAYDLVISGYEPITARIARRYRLPDGFSGAGMGRCDPGQNGGADHDAFRPGGYRVTKI